MATKGGSVMIFYKKILRKFFRDERHWEEISFFKTVPLFHRLGSRQLARLILAMQKRTYRTGEVLFTEGQIGKAVFVVRSGKVEITRKLSNGKTRKLAQVETGQMFGEMALLEHMPREATATTVEDSEIYLLYTSTLEALIQKRPTLGVVLMQNMAVLLSSHLRRANRELDNLGTSRD